MTTTHHKHHIATEEERKALIEAYSNGEDTKTLAHQLHIPLRTANFIITSNKTTHPGWGGFRGTVISEAMKADLISWVEGDCTVTLEMLRSNLRHKYQVNVALSTISNALAGELITMKAVHPVTAEHNSPDNKDKRQEYAHHYLSVISQGRTVFLDETNFGVWAARTRGRAVKGKRAELIVPALRGKSVSILAAIDNVEGLVHTLVTMENIHNTHFQQFLLELQEKLPDTGDVFIVLDNAPIHTTLPTTLRQNIHIKHIPPYSPQLNAIEEVFSVLKNEAKKNLRLLMPELIDPAFRKKKKKTIKEFRAEALKVVANQALQKVTREVCVACVGHVLKSIEKALNKEDL